MKTETNVMAYILGDYDYSRETNTGIYIITTLIEISSVITSFVVKYTVLIIQHAWNAVDLIIFNEKSNEIKAIDKQNYNDDIL
jgi:hypothetical protein